MQRTFTVESNCVEFYKKLGGDKMFDSKKNKPRSVLEATVFSSIIEKGMLIEGGVLKGEGNVRINGTFSGDITIDGNISVGSEGSINGNVCANSVDIFGSCKGDVTGFSLIHLSDTAILEGNIQSETVVIDQNAKFNGTCRMGTVIAPSTTDTAVQPNEEA